MQRLFRLFSVRGVPVLVHWSVLAISLFLLGAARTEILPVFLGLAAYLGTVLLHEIGHQMVAKRRGYHVARIEIYPIHGLCRFEEPEYPLDAAAIAWGGVAAQFVVAIPLVVALKVFGYPNVGLIGIPIAMFAYVSPATALFNLLPIAPLDGALAWSYFRHRFSSAARARRTDENTALQAFEDAIRKVTKSR